MMRKISIILLFILFFIQRDAVIIGSIEAINLWKNNIFPILFPTFIISDLLLSSGILNDLIKHFGTLFSRITHINPYGLYIFLMSMIAGTPTNAKNLKILYDNNIITQKDLEAILQSCIFFNPILIISMAGYRVLIIIWLANLLAAIIQNRKQSSIQYMPKEINIPFNLNQSLAKNMTIILNILGTITFYMVIANIFPIKNHWLKTLLSGFLEITNGLNRTHLYFPQTYKQELLNLIFISFGGISIHTQIKSILADTKINYRNFLKSRILTATIAIVISWATKS